MLELTGVCSRQSIASHDAPPLSDETPAYYHNLSSVFEKDFTPLGYNSGGFS
jgi:hypothetical protein